jgi:cytidylate kinase
VTVIAVDGPAASGKGTLARKLAQHFGFHHLDTGLLYRAVGFQAADRIDDPSAAIRIAQAFDPGVLIESSLRSDEVARLASKVSAIPEVRTALLDFQRRFAAKPPGAVLDGRDIGTVICPDAPAKLYVTAQVEVRAARRLKELQANGVATIYAAVLQDLIDRDARDSKRAAAPLKVADGAFLLDTSGLSPEDVFATALAWITPRI